MTQPRSPRPPRRAAARPNSDYRWSAPKAQAFLRALALGRSVAAAAREVGMSRQSAYRLRVRLGDGFAALWDDGRRLARQARAARECEFWGGGLAAGGPQGDSRGAR